MRFLPAPAVAVAVLAVAGCTPAAEPGGGGPAVPAVAALEPVWTSEVRADGLGSWETDDAVVLTAGRGLVALDPATGAPQWRLRLPAEPCEWSTDPSDDGLLAVLLVRREKPRTCRDVAVVDLADGRIRWQVSVEHPAAADYAPARFDGVSAGERVVAVTDSVLDGAVRLDVRTGRVLSTAADDDARGVTSDGDHLFTLDLDNDGPSRISVVDQDTGRHVGAYDAGESYELHPVLRDPLVLGADRGHFGSDLYAGADGVPVGRGLPLYAGADGDRLVSVFDSALVVSDLTTGTEIGAAPLLGFDSVVGISDGALLTVGSQVASPDSSSLVLQRTDLTDLSDQRVLGALAARPVAAAHDVVVTVEERGVVAYGVPADGPGQAESLDVLDWADGDLRPADAFDACLAVAPETRRLAGVDPHGPVVGSCEWGSGERVVVSVEAALPNGSRSAVEVATDLAGLTASGDAEEIADVGDEAWLAANESGAFLTVRYRNVVLDLYATAHDLSSGRARSGALAVARDVVAELERRAG